MHDHNLDDLILDAKPSTTGRAKNILSLLALFIIVLIAGIVFYKIFLTEHKIVTAETEENISKYYDDPDLKPQQAPENLSLALRDDEEEEEFISIPSPSPKPSTTPKVQKPKPAPSPAQHKQVHTPPKPQPQAKPKKTHITAKPAKTVPKVRQKPVVRKKESATSTRYYVQVGSFSKPPQHDSRLLSAIRNSGYRYTVYKAPNGMRKILIGPYKSRTDADKAIIDIRSRINKNAFVFTLKK
jgi:DedD protein